MIGVYIHIPFCLSKCSYCDFFSVPVERKNVPHQRYCGVLVKQFAHDVSRLGLQDRGVTSIYFGGGTPSLMPASFYEKLLWLIGTTFVMQSDIEITCEVNPATVDAVWFKRMVDAGVTRFSIGVQSFDDAKLKRLGRLYTSAEAQQAIAEAQDSGVTSVNVDLMYGLPGQRLADVESDLTLAMSFQPQHLSAYQLTLEPGTVLERHLRSSGSRISLPRDEQVLKQLRLVRRMLVGGGWEPYEISNFAKHGFACHHNLHYWHYGEFLGLGCGATSFILAPGRGGGRTMYASRWITMRDVAKYLNGRYDREDVENVSRRTAMGEFCFLGLRTTEGISLAAFARRFGTSFNRAFPGMVADLEKRELASLQEGDRLVLTPRGIELSNLVFESFVE